MLTKVYLESLLLVSEVRVMFSVVGIFEMRSFSEQILSYSQNISILIHATLPKARRTEMEDGSNHSPHSAANY